MCEEAEKTFSSWLGGKKVFNYDNSESNASPASRKIINFSLLGFEIEKFSTLKSFKAKKEVLDLRKRTWKSTLFSFHWWHFCHLVQWVGKSFGDQNRSLFLQYICIHYRGRFMFRKLQCPLPMENSGGNIRNYKSLFPWSLSHGIVNIRVAAILWTFALHFSHLIAAR